MGLFSKINNKASQASVNNQSPQQSRGIIDDIRWDMTQDDLIYKFPYNDIKVGSVLTVHESQRAVFFQSGTFVGSFERGRHELTTQNFPFISKLLNIATAGRTTFTAEVWFVNTEKINKNRWGTGGQLRIFDSYYNMAIKLMSRGQYEFIVNDAELFLKKMVGNLKEFTVQDIYEHFDSEVVSTLKAIIPQYMQELNITVDHLSGHLLNVAKKVRHTLEEYFNGYGLEIKVFSIEDLEVDESDPTYQKKKELLTYGEDYNRVNQFDIMKDAANNPGMAGASMGTGMGFGMGQMMGNMMMGQSAAQQTQPQAPPQASVPPPIPQLQIFVAQNGQSTGPFDMEKLKEMLAQHILTKDSMVWKEGLANWQAASTLDELKPLFNSSTPPPPPPPLV